MSQASGVIALSVTVCDECKPSAQPTDDTRVHTLTDRERYAFLYSGARWQRLRDVAIRRCPVCARCDRNLSEIVDHIVPAGVAIAQARNSGLYSADGYAGFYIESNLQGLCRSCHFWKTAEDKTHAGPWPDVLEIQRLAPKRRFTF